MWCLTGMADGGDKSFGSPSKLSQDWLIETISGVSKGIDYQCIWIIILIFQRKRAAKSSSVLCGTLPFSQLFDVTSHCPHRGLLRAVVAQTVPSKLMVLDSSGSATWANYSKTGSWCSAAPWYWFQYLLWSSSGKWTWFIQSSSAQPLMKIVARLVSIKRITWKQSTACLSDGIFPMSPTLWGNMKLLCLLSWKASKITPQRVGDFSFLN